MRKPTSWCWSEGEEHMHKPCCSKPKTSQKFWPDSNTLASHEITARPTEPTMGCFCCCRPWCRQRIRAVFDSVLPCTDHQDRRELAEQETCQIESSAAL